MSQYKPSTSADTDEFEGLPSIVRSELTALGETVVSNDVKQLDAKIRALHRIVNDHYQRTKRSYNDEVDELSRLTAEFRRLYAQRLGSLNAANEVETLPQLESIKAKIRNMSHTKPTAEDTLAWQVFDRKRQDLQVSIRIANRFALGLSHRDKEMMTVNVDLIPPSTFPNHQKHIVDWKDAKQSWDTMIDELVKEHWGEDLASLATLAGCKFDGLCPEPESTQAQ